MDGNGNFRGFVTGSSTLKQAAATAVKLGFVHAVNVDGGSSASLHDGNRWLVKGNRPPVVIAARKQTPGKPLMRACK